MCNIAQSTEFWLYFILVAAGGPRYVYIIECKRDKTAEEALWQIEEMHYELPYAADSRRLIKIGANFDSKTRGLNEWKVRSE